MAADWAAILGGIAQNLQAISPGLKVVDYYRDSLAVGIEGLAEIGPASASGTTNMEHARVTGPTMKFFVTVSLYLSTVAEDAAQSRMLAYMSRGNDVSVWDALNLEEGFPLNALTGVARKMLVMRSHSYGNLIRENGLRLLTNSWDLEVTATAD